MEKLLKIYTYVDGVNDTPFPNADAQIEIFSFNYNAKRMGGAPTISTSVMYKDCLDKLWTGKEYVRYNDERYRLKQTPTSSKNNTDARYKHDLELVALRNVLDFVYFFDAVVGNTPVDDKPVTNSTKVVFSGDIHEFAKRLNASLKYTKLDYSVVVDEGITSETKFLEFTDQPISSVLQEIYKQYEIPYYFVGDVIHIGFTSNAITTPFKYSVNDALLSISKNNANNKIVNRCTGVGSSENIPYYYPNEHPLGEVDAYYNGVKDNSLIVNKKAYADNTKLSSVLLYKEYKPIIYATTSVYNFETAREWILSPIYINARQYRAAALFKDDASYSWLNAPFRLPYVLRDASEDDRFLMLEQYKPLGAYQIGNLLTEGCYFSRYNKMVGVLAEITHDGVKTAGVSCYLKDFNDALVDDFDIKVYSIPKNDDIDKSDKEAVLSQDLALLSDNIWNANEYEPYLFVWITPNQSYYENTYFKVDLELTANEYSKTYSWYNEQGSIVELGDYGLAYNSAPVVGDKITFKQVEGSLIPFQDTLMPPIYWQSKGIESFYNALNDTYISPETGTYYEFENEYSDDNRREHKETFDYIKPSIEFVRNGDSMPINMFLNFAYDDNDSDEIDEATNEYIHPYFYAKLRKFNGDFGFNLFDHANEKGEMTISMTSGDCGACQFVIGVEENTKKNIVQVDKNGNLLRDEYGRVIRTGEPQNEQNDTINNEVWIALKKDTQTFGTLLPNKSIKPKACSGNNSADGDTFVITNISLPVAYIREAEERLKEEIIKYIKLNNSEKFTFSIRFSRIYLAENPNIFAQLNENARIQIEYNGVPYELYVSSYQYKVVGNEALPEITVELADSLSTNENAIQQAISAVEHSIMSSVGSIDFYKQGLRYFIRKDVEDFAREIIHLQKGATFGIDDIAKIDEQGNAEFVSQVIRQFIATPKFIDGFAGEGFKLWLNELGRANLTVDNITVRETFRVFELLVSKLRAVNGGLFVSAANGTIKSVEESGDNFAIILEQENTFIAGDYMRCQVMNGNDLANWWVEVENTDAGAIYVKKTQFNGSIPLVGQEVVLCGSKNKDRQNAIHISATNDGQPRIDILNGISTKSFEGCLRTRLGNLDGIYDEEFGNKQPHGDGLYSDNAFLKGEFILANRGESVDTLFAIQDGKIQSSVAQTQTETIKGKTLLYNASFTKGLDGWQTSNEYDLYTDVDNLLVNESSILQDSVAILANSVNENVFAVRINNGWIQQFFWQFIDKPSFEDAKAGDSGLYPLKVSMNIKPNTNGGYLYVGVNDAITNESDILLFLVQEQLDDLSFSFRTGNIVGVSKTYILYPVSDKFYQKGDIILVDVKNQKCSEDGETWYDAEIAYTGFLQNFAFTPNLAYNIVVKEPLQVKSEFYSLSVDAKWNGDGNFLLYSTGSVDVYGLQLYTDTIEVVHKTLFEQTDRLIQLSAAIYEKNEDGLKMLQEAGLSIQAEGAGLYARQADGSQALIAAYTSEEEGGKILLKGDKIQLEGDISANGNVHIDAETGTLTAKDGVFTGKITSEEGYIGGFTIRAEDLFTELNEQENEDYYKTMLLSKQVIHFHSHEYVPEQEYNGVIVEQEFVKNIHVRLGANTLPSTLGFESAPLKIDIDDNHKANVNIGAYIDVVNASAKDNSVMTGNHAIYIPNGDICGFRLRTRRINEDTTLSAMDSVILVTSACTITLPENAEDGQIYIFKRMGGQLTYIILPQGDDKIWGYTSVTESIEVTSSVSIILHYDKINKYWCGGFLSHFT